MTLLFFCLSLYFLDERGKKYGHRNCVRSGTAWRMDDCGYYIKAQKSYWVVKSGNL